MKKGTLMVLASYVLWGLLTIFWKLLADIDSFYVLCCRIVFSLAVSAALLPLTGGWAAAKAVLKDRKLLLRMLACGLLISFNWGVLIYCVSAGRVLDTSLAYYISRLLAILLGFILFREKLTAAQWVSVIIAAIGVAAPMVMAGQFPYLALLCGLFPRPRPMAAGKLRLQEFFVRRRAASAAVSVYSKRASRCRTENYQDAFLTPGIWPL